jgi:uncharacterized protein YneF (UPF0154 family)
MPSWPKRPVSSKTLSLQISTTVSCGRRPINATWNLILRQVCSGAVVALSVETSTQPPRRLGLGPLEISLLLAIVALGAGRTWGTFLDRKKIPDYEVPLVLNLKHIVLLVIVASLLAAAAVYIFIFNR